jgi:competence protein ComEC
LQGDGRWLRRFTSHLAALALTSALAGIASMPFGAYHFGHIQLYFILANMIAVPMAALWAMPAGLIGLLLMPFSLDWLAFIPMGWGVSAILFIARTTAALPAATLNVPHMPPWGLGLTGLGIAWLGLWRSRLRLAGVPVIVLGLLTPLLVRPPDLLVSADARLIGFRVGHSIYIQHESGASKFTRESWLQYWAAAAAEDLPKDGDTAEGAVSCGADACLLRPVEHAKAAMLVRGAVHPDGCAETSVIVSAEPARRLCPRPWPALVDRFTVWRYGATAIWLEARHARILTDRAYRGIRPWVPPMPTPRTRPAPTLAPAQTDAAADPRAQ